MVGRGLALWMISHAGSASAQPAVEPVSAGVASTVFAPGAVFAGAAAARVLQQAPPPAGAPAPRGVRLPRWLSFHGEQRIRFESMEHRYRATEVGGDDVMGFRTRLQARVASNHVLAIAELQDARMALTDSASTITNRMTSHVKFSQLSLGARWRGLGRAKLNVQLEVGRFSRDYGNGRLIARPPYGNVSNSQDGFVVGVSGRNWSVQGLGGRPAIYAYPSLDFDDRFRTARFGGVYSTYTPSRRFNVDLYWLHLDDGSRFTPVASRRQFETSGVRLFGVVGPGGRVEYENESVVQWGEFGVRRHQAWLEHAQVGYSWPAVPLHPRLIAIYDHASGDADPTDQRSGTFDTLYGRSRFELGPTGIFGLVARSNLQSPGVWLITNPIRSIEVSLQHRWAWLAQARDRWRPIGLTDPTGRAGRELGTQTDLRLRYRWKQHLEFDSAAVLFTEGDFVRALRPSPSGRSMFYMASTEWRF